MPNTRSPLELEITAVACTEWEEGSAGELLTTEILGLLAQLIKAGISLEETFALGRFCFSQVASDNEIFRPDLEASELTFRAADELMVEIVEGGGPRREALMHLLLICSEGFPAFSRETGFSIEATLLWQMQVLDLAEKRGREHLESC